MALPRLRVCQERSAVRQQWSGSSQDVLRAHERLSWMEPWQLLWRRVDICSSSSISRSGTTRSSRLRRSPILHACASCTLQSSTTDDNASFNALQLRNFILTIHAADLHMHLVEIDSQPLGNVPLHFRKALLHAWLLST